MSGRFNQGGFGTLEDYEGHAPQRNFSRSAAPMGLMNNNFENNHADEELDEEEPGNGRLDVELSDELGHGLHMDGHEHHVPRHPGAPEMTAPATPSTITLHFHLEGSLASLQAGGPVARMSLEGDGQRLVELHQALKAGNNLGAVEGSARTGQQQVSRKGGMSSAIQSPSVSNAENCTLSSVVIARVKNDMPTDLAIRFVGLPGVKTDTSAFSASGHAANLIAWPGDNREVNMTVLKMADTPHFFLQQHPGRNMGNIDKGVVDNPSMQFTLVDQDHPLIDVINNIREKRGIEPLSSASVMHGMYAVNKAEASSAMAALKDALRTDIGLVSLANIGLEVFRPVSPQGKQAASANHTFDRDLSAASAWTSPVGLSAYPNYFDPKTRDAFLARPGNLRVEVKISYFPVQ